MTPLVHFRYHEIWFFAIRITLRARGGDVLIRALHRRNPNTTTTSCPMVEIGYSRKWLRRPKLDIHISLRVDTTIYSEVKLKGCFVLKTWLAMTIIWKEYTGLEKYDAEILTKISGKSIS